MTKDEEISNYMMVIEQCKEQMNQLEMQAQYLQAAMMDYHKAKMTLEKLKEVEKDTDMLIPLGGGTFIDAIAKKQTKPLIDVGSGIVLEKTYEGAIKKIAERIDQLEKTQTRLDEMIQQVQNDASEASTKAQKLIDKEKK